MRVDARFVDDHVPFDSPLDSHLVISLTGEKSSTRPRLGIIPVLDRTGSMGTDSKMPIAIEALSHVTGFLAPEDALGLVVFDSVVDTLVEPGPFQQDRYLASLREVFPRGMTNLAAGLRRGVDLAAALAAKWSRENVGPFEIRVLLVSDGLANVGETSPDAISRIVCELPAGVRVTTVGVGYDCDHDLLRQLAVIGGGSYGFAEDSAAIPRLLGAEFGAALSVDASDIVVKVKSSKKMMKLSDPYSMSGVSHTGSGGFKIKIPTLLSGEIRHIVLPVTTIPPGRKHARRVTGAVVSVKNSITDKDSIVEIRPKVFFDNKKSSPAPTLVAAVEQARAAHALSNAERLAASGDMKAASLLLRSAKSSASPAMAAALDEVSAFYVSPTAYTNSAPDRSSWASSLTGDGRLLGSSESFDASYSRTVGESYVTDSMRDAASQTVRSVSDALDSKSAQHDSSNADIDMKGSVSDSVTVSFTNDMKEDPNDC